jgi:uncharacterized SAM-dependent methyltransferase
MIRTEICAKFSNESLSEMVVDAGMSIDETYSDPLGWFTLALLKKQ